MTDCRKFSQNKNYLNYNSTNRMLLLIYATALMFASHSSAVEMESNNTICSDASSCTKCTVKAQCSWSLDQQACVNKSQLKLSRLTVDSKDKCPRFSVVTKYEYDDEFSNLHYIVKVLNDSVGFVDFLHKSKFVCKSPIIRIYKKEMKNDEIVCSASVQKDQFEVYNGTVQSLTAFIFFNFNDVMLRFDDIADHYVTVYRQKCAEDDKQDKYCATCTWDDDGGGGFMHYVKLCSFRSCEGHSEMYSRHNGVGQSFNFTSQRIRDRCAKINVTAVSPLTGTQAGNETLMITVKNHWLLAENRTVAVTVAGTACANPELLGSETITCTTSPPPEVAYEAPSGPVLVEYSSGRGKLTVESSQTFRFYVGTTCGAPRPALDREQTLYGVDSGGTTVPLRGVHFVKPCIASPARMFVMHPNGTMLFASSLCDPPVSDTNMVCRSPRVYDDDDWYSLNRSLNFGLYLMNFSENQSLYVNGSPSGYEVSYNPQLFDFTIKYQHIVFRGRHLQHIRADDITLRFLDSPGVSCDVVFVWENSFKCNPTTSTRTAATPLHSISVQIGNSLSYFVDNTEPFRLEDHSDPPGQVHWFKLHVWCVVTLSLVLFCVSFCYYRMKHRYGVLKPVHDPPEVLHDLDVQTAL